MAACVADEDPTLGPYYHVGWPPDPEAAFERLRSGRPVYWPTDPKVTAQGPYIRFAEKRPPNSE